jgi:hypothetical protein
MFQTRLIQFTLRRMFLATAIIAFLLAMFAKPTVDYRQSLACAKVIAEMGGTVYWNPELIETLIRDQAVARVTDVRFQNPRIDAEGWQQLAKLPMRFGLHIEGPSFTDESLDALIENRHLSYLVLCATSINEDDVIRFQAARPDIHVMFGYPGDKDFQDYPARIQ